VKVENITKKKIKRKAKKDTESPFLQLGEKLSIFFAFQKNMSLN
jgi:hypothetical protein